MKEKPIIFSGPMVRAILDGRKTQTRRVVKPQPHETVGGLGSMIAWRDFRWCRGGSIPDVAAECPYGQPGDRLWVRETWADTSKESRRCPVSYRATWPPDDEECRGFAWKPSIFMPRWASRLTLEVTGVRVERVQDITEEDALAEGVAVDIGLPYCDPETPSARMMFKDLWNSINSRRSFGWDMNPFVWVVSFRRVRP